MFKYKGVHCPYCDKEFEESDSIAVCPDCGAPYHQECAKESGGCVLRSLHEKGEQWQPPHIRTDEEKYDGASAKRCSRCGTVNSANGLFCEVCGNALNNQGSDKTPPFAETEGQRPNFMAYNPYTTPFGGVGPDEKIDGLPVKDLAIYVQDNTPYFIPRLKAVAQTGKGGGWNWAAFLFDFYYFVYRKMWGMAAVAFVVSLVLSIPSLFSVIQTMQAVSSGADAIPELSNTVLAASQVCAMLSWIVKGLFGAFANRLYVQKTLQRVHKLHHLHHSEPNYSTILSQKGGTSKTGLILCVVIPFILSFIMSMIYAFSAVG